MTKENQIKNMLLFMVFGDALGFLNENSSTREMEFNHFIFYYDDQLQMEKSKGQWSYVTELALIIIKCLLDRRDQSCVVIDYGRLDEELKLWKYYRHGNPFNLLGRLDEGKDYYTGDLYWNDKRGNGISRILLTYIANKNFSVAEKEGYQQILYLNRHPQVILTGMILGRMVYLLMEKGRMDREELIDELKNYLIHLKLQYLEGETDICLPKGYSIQFEREKIEYLITLDRLKRGEGLKPEKWSSKSMLTASVMNYWKLVDGKVPEWEILPSDDIKESLAISYGLWGIHQKDFKYDINQLSNWQFISGMGEYLGKIRNYEVNRKYFSQGEIHYDLFQLEKNQVIKHPIFNVTKIKDRLETLYHIQVVLETKSGLYVMVKRKDE